MQARKLKLPDGGTLDMPIPPDFGGAVFAMNEADESILFGAPEVKTIIVGALVGAAIVAAVIYFRKTQAA